MPSPFRMAAVAALFLSVVVVVESARSQELAPPGSDVSIHKLVIESAFSHTVKYHVKGGSPRLQALVRRVEWAENELSVIEQLQRLKLDTVVNERRVAAFRTAQLTNPYYPPAFIPLPIATGNGGDGASPLQRALKRQLACEATPEAALQLIGFLEQLQTDLAKELKALPPQEQKAAQGPIDALRPRVAALSRRDVPLPPQPVVPPRILGFSPVYREPMGTTGPVAAPQVRFRAQAVPPQLPMPPDPVAFQQMVLQNQERVRQQILQTQQQVMQRHQEIIQQHQLRSMGLQR